MVAETKVKIKQTCGTCGADRKEILNCLLDSTESDNFWQAIHMIDNCPDCKQAINEAFERLREAGK